MEVKNTEIKKNKISVEKQSEIEEITEKITDAVKNQIDFLSSDDTSKSEKIKEYTRLAIFMPTMIIPKILILISYGLPAYIITKIFFLYFGIMPENSETENKTIKSINSKTGMNFLLKNRPIFYKEIRHIILERMDRFKSSVKKIIRV